MSINKHEKVQKKRTPYTKEHYSFVTGVQFTPPPGFNNLEWLMGGGRGGDDFIFVGAEGVS